MLKKFQPKGKARISDFHDTEQGKGKLLIYCTKKDCSVVGFLRDPLSLLACFLLIALPCQQFVLVFFDLS